MDDVSKVINLMVVSEDARPHMAVAIDEHAHILDRVEAWCELYELADNDRQRKSAVDAIKKLCEDER